MAEIILHHLTVPATDLERSVAFYQDMFGLKRLERPPFKMAGAWLECGPSLQLHVVGNPDATFRDNRRIDIYDVHFAFRTDDFEAVMDDLTGRGYSEDAPEGDPKKLLVFRKGVAAFPQLYLLDPDGNTIEVNGAS
jgi:catechol 2,3-dioxygenase-like lactoylglutathione lyase family enzyme